VGAEWKMSGFAGQMSYQAIGKFQRWPSPEQLERRRDNLRLLQDYVLVIKEHLERRCKFVRAELVDFAKRPGSLNQGKHRKLV